MWAFGLSVLLLIVVCIAIIWPAAGRRSTLNQIDIVQENLQITRQRLAELKRVDEISAADERELEAAFLDDLQGPDYSNEQTRPGSRSSIFLIITVLPIAAISLYSVLGNTQWQNQNEVSSVAPSHPEGSIESTLAGLESSLLTNPDNFDGWKLAGRTYMSLGRYADAEQAYARADKLGGGNPDILTSWADASLMANGGQFTDEIILRVRRALTLNPNQKNALWIAGIGAQSKGDSRAALGFFTKLRPMLENGSDSANRVDMLIVQSGGELDLQPEATTVAQVSPEAAAINVKVEISEKMSKLANPDDLVFVFARKPGGPPFPLAVLRVTVADLPAEIVLDDSLAMVEGQNISSVEQVVVTARVSRSGKPISQAGDLTSSGITIATAGSPELSLLIDQVVE